MEYFIYTLSSTYQYTEITTVKLRCERIFLKMLMGTQLRIYIVHHVWTLERRYRGLDGLNACYFSDRKEGWPGMVIDHVIIPGTKRVRSLIGMIYAL
jgi:hypothetical protein